VQLPSISHICGIRKSSKNRGCQGDLAPESEKEAYVVMPNKEANIQYQSRREERTGWRIGRDAHLETAAG
jgi:hypothetical protein